jgi:hypothetical protein
MSEQGFASDYEVSATSGIILNGKHPPFFGCHDTHQLHAYTQGRTDGHWDDTLLIGSTESQVEWTEVSEWLIVAAKLSSEPFDCGDDVYDDDGSAPHEEIVCWDLTKPMVAEVQSSVLPQRTTRRSPRFAR